MTLKRGILALIAGFLALVGWIVYRHWTLPQHPIDPRRFQSVTIYYGTAKQFGERASDLDQHLHVTFEAQALDTTFHKAALQAGGLSVKHPTWLAVATLDDGTECQIKISHVGVFEVVGQRGIYELPKTPDIVLRAFDIMANMKDSGTGPSTQPVRKSQ